MPEVVPCAACGRTVSVNERHCIHCGAAMIGQAPDAPGDDGPAPPILALGSAPGGRRRGTRRGGGGRGRGRARRGSGGGALKTILIGCGAVVVLGCGGILLLGVWAKGRLSSPSAQRAVQLCQSLQVNASLLGSDADRDARRVAEDVAQAILGNDGPALESAARRCDRLTQAWRQRARQLESRDLATAARAELCADDAGELAAACRDRADELR